MSAADDVARLAGRRVLVVGDLVLDEYWTGRAARISREAPVPILEFVEYEDRAGSAASPAANITALGSQATVVGALGSDAAGERVAASLHQLGVDADGLVRVPNMPTPTKTRILAQGFTGGLHGRQQMLRLDRGSPLPPDVARACAACLTRLAPTSDAILLSDYRGGVIDDATLAAARAAGRPITVDSQGDVRRFAGVDLLKVNQAEAHAALGGADLLEGAARLRDDLRIRHLVITLGAEGMLLFSGAAPISLPAVRVTEVFDVTGAGDTVIALLTLGLIAGLPLQRAAELASAAASIVVRRLGVATVSPRELIEVIARES